ncbi:MAG: YeeE/YedE family protein [Candidatus Muirbacterium halophilum]|nr:YeeE/YedE family protein [Candidatus Muirbacterium halophilum]
MVKNKTPYIYGILTGLLMIISVFISGKFFGASTTFARGGGMLEKLLLPARVLENSYFIKYAPKFDWQFLFVIGIGIGAFISAYLAKEFKFKYIPDMWKKEIGVSKRKRNLFAFMGGLLVIIGARMAGGCPSGHGLSGIAQLSISGFVSVIFFVIGGAISSNLIYKGGKK